MSELGALQEIKGGEYLHFSFEMGNCDIFQIRKCTLVAFCDLENGNKLQQKMLR